MCDPSRYSARIIAVKASFFRMSGTVNALRIVETIEVPGRLLG
jgi:hypothetical protein